MDKNWCNTAHCKNHTFTNKKKGCRLRNRCFCLFDMIQICSLTEELPSKVFDNMSSRYWSFQLLEVLISSLRDPRYNKIIIMEVFIQVKQHLHPIKEELVHLFQLTTNHACHKRNCHVDRSR